MYYDHDMMDGWGAYGSYGIWGWIFMSLMMLVFLLIIIVAVRYFIREWQKGGQKDSALGMLKERYAKGEVNKKEFEEKKKDLAE